MLKGSGKLRVAGIIELLSSMFLLGYWVYAIISFVSSVNEFNNRYGYGYYRRDIQIPPIAWFFLMLVVGYHLYRLLVSIHAVRKADVPQSGGAVMGNSIALLVLSLLWLLFMIVMVGESEELLGIVHTMIVVMFILALLDVPMLIVLIVGGAQNKSSAAYMAANPYGAPNPYMNPNPYANPNPYGNPAAFGGQNPYGNQMQYANQNPYGNQLQFGGQNPYANPQQFGNPNPYGNAQQFANQQQYGNQPQFGNQNPYMNPQNGFGANNPNAQFNNNQQAANANMNTAAAVSEAQSAASMSGQAAAQAPDNTPNAQSAQGTQETPNE